MTAPHIRHTQVSPASGQGGPLAPPRRPPPHQPPVEPTGPSRARWTVAIVALAVAALLIGGLLLRDALAPAAEPPLAADSPPAADRDPDSGQGTPADDADAQLAALRASDRYLAIAPHDRAAGLEWPPGMDGAWESFQWFRTYANQEALWDEVVAPIRDDALLAGEPYTGPIWDEEYPVEAYVPNGWTDDTTEGRGDAYTFAVRFADAADGEPVERWHAVLIRPGADGAGELIARMDHFDLRRGDAPGFPEAVGSARERVWEWVQQQPVEEAGR